MMRTLYFKRYKQRGVPATFNWLKDELDELYEALQEGNIEDAKEEFADVMAWLASLANIVDVDLEKTVLKKIPLFVSQM